MTHEEALAEIKAMKSAPPAPKAKRCPLCNYQYGHQIGCENNLVDIALKARSDAEKLAVAIAEAATKAGITDASKHSFSGPQLLMLLDDLVRMATQASVVQEPVYQYQLADGSWIDQIKDSHDYNVRHGQATVRTLYTHPAPVREPLTPEQIDRILGTVVPGGSQVRDWFLPHETDKGLDNVRQVVGLMLEAAHGDEDGDVKTRYEMVKSWLVEANASNETLKKHLENVLEIAHTWQPGYATKMDRDTLALAAQAIG